MSALKLKLDQDQLVEDFFESTHLMGIVSSARDYQLSWQLNRQLHYPFRVNNSLEIKLTKHQRSFFFTVYEFQEPTKSVSHYLYNNHCKAEFLLPELKNIDYLWLIKGDYYGPQDVKKLTEALRHVELVQLVSLLDLREIKNKVNLIF
ncbi:IPExxxVDY family protein [Chitinophaga agrisoli]|uniref:IPExxxVDY family protein n=1 Tax=Chitinophaga agrisoli TaxID=2607653 RepID=A0A5B2W2G8_9BACT|nr:IPExxxVDY family protein [Chitinophaga agrisoli]KAA2245264.1 IPExxxVDY family protein [Chitinophaga agrisoli]